MCRVYIRQLILSIVVLIGGSFSSVYAKDTEFLSGKHFLRVPDHIRAKEDVVQLISADPGKVQVLMFFSYGCYWCSQVNRPFDKWAESRDDVVIHTYPVVFNRMWHVLAKLYYTVETYDNKAVLDDEVFDAIHHRKVRIWQDPAMKKFFTQQGLDFQKFQDVFNSFNTDRQVRRAKEIAEAFEIAATPNFIVNGPSGSYLTNLTMTDNPGMLFDILDYLVALEAGSLEKAA